MLSVCVHVRRHIVKPYACGGNEKNISVSPPNTARGGGDTYCYILLGKPVSYPISFKHSIFSRLKIIYTWSVFYRPDNINFCFFFDVLLTVHLSIFISVINQLDAQNFCLTVSLFHASTCFEHMCSSSGGQNCITQPLVSSHL